MASELPVLRDDHGRALRIGPTQTGAVGINVADGMHPILVVLSGERLAAFREALDRAAMPGQEARRGQGGGGARWLRSPTR